MERDCSEQETSEGIRVCSCWSICCVQELADLVEGYVLTLLHVCFVVQNTVIGMFEGINEMLGNAEYFDFKTGADQTGKVMQADGCLWKFDKEGLGELKVANLETDDAKAQADEVFNLKRTLGYIVKEYAAWSKTQEDTIYDSSLPNNQAITKVLLTLNAFASAVANEEFSMEASDDTHLSYQKWAQQLKLNTNKQLVNIKPPGELAPL